MSHHRHTLLAILVNTTPEVDFHAKDCEHDVGHPLELGARECSPGCTMWVAKWSLGGRCPAVLHFFRVQICSRSTVSCPFLGRLGGSIAGGGVGSTADFQRKKLLTFTIIWRIMLKPQIRPPFLCLWMGVESALGLNSRGRCYKPHALQLSLPIDKSQTSNATMDTFK